MQLKTIEKPAWGRSGSLYCPTLWPWLDWHQFRLHASTRFGGSWRTIPLGTPDNSDQLLRPSQTDLGVSAYGNLDTKAESECSSRHSFNSYNVYFYLGLHIYQLEPKTFYTKALLQLFLILIAQTNLWIINYEIWLVRTVFSVFGDIWRFVRQLGPIVLDKSTSYGKTLGLNEMRRNLGASEERRNWWINKRLHKISCLRKRENNYINKVTLLIREVKLKKK